MRIRVVQIWGFLMTVLGWIFVACTMAMEGWKITSIGGMGGSSIIKVAWYWSSLWRSCFTDSTAVSNCYDFPVLWSKHSSCSTFSSQQTSHDHLHRMKYRTLVMYMEIGCFVSCLCGWILVCSTLPTEYWTFSEVGSIVLTTSNYYSNLWRDCISDTTGVSDCKDYPSMLALPAFLHACRALAVCAVITGFFGGVLTLIICCSGLKLELQFSSAGAAPSFCCVAGQCWVTSASARTRRTYMMPGSASRVTLVPPLF